MTTFVEGRNLFDILDVNRDRRLSRREFDIAAARIPQWDTNHDGQLDASEIPESLRLEFGRGNAAMNSRRAAAPAMRGDESPAASGTGPIWFQKMDRNHDGDVSEREFLGPREAFEKIDANHDGLIDATEARNSERGTRN